MPRPCLRRAGLLLAAFGLGACQSGPPPTPATLPHINPLAQLPAGTQAEPLPRRWWALYRDPRLDALVTQALAHNQDLAQADAHVAALMAGIAREQAAQGPSTQVAVAGQYGRSADDQTLAQAQGGHADAHWALEPAAQLSWQLDLWGQVRAAIAAAQADAAAAAAARDQLRLTVAAQTTQAWLDLCGLGAQQAVRRQSMASLGQSLDLLDRQRRAGLVTALDTRRLQALAARTGAELPWLAAQQRMAREQLIVLTGAQADVAIECEQIPQLSGGLPVGDGWALLQRRPDIREAQRRLLARDWRIEQVRADLYPSVRFGAEVSSSAASVHGLGAGQAVMFGIGPLVSWQFPNRRANQARLDAAQAERDAQRAAWHGQVLNALKDVRQSLARYDGERQRRQALDQAADESRQAFALADRNYRAGALDGLARLDAERDLIAARDQQVQAARRQARAEIMLFSALGGGWQDTSRTTAP